MAITRLDEDIKNQLFYSHILSKPPKSHKRQLTSRIVNILTYPFNEKIKP
jgi:hypothetical protein